MQAESKTSDYLVDCHLIKWEYQLDIIKKVFVPIPLIIPFKAQWLLYVPPGVTCKNRNSSHKIYLRV